MRQKFKKKQRKSSEQDKWTKSMTNCRRAWWRKQFETNKQTNVIY